MAHEKLAIIAYTVLPNAQLILLVFFDSHFFSFLIAQVKPPSGLSMAYFPLSQFFLLIS